MEQLNGNVYDRMRLTAATHIPHPVVVFNIDCFNCIFLLFFFLDGESLKRYSSSSSYLSIVWGNKGTVFLFCGGWFILMDPVLSARMFVRHLVVCLFAWLTDCLTDWRLLCLRPYMSCLSGCLERRAENHWAGKEMHRPGNLTTHRPSDVAFGWISLALSASCPVTEVLYSKLPIPVSRVSCPRSWFLGSGSGAVLMLPAVLASDEPLCAFTFVSVKFKKKSQKKENIEKKCTQKLVSHTRLSICLALYTEKYFVDEKERLFQVTL